MRDDPYDALGLAKAATATDIRRACHRPVRASLPDLRPDDPAAEARFKALSAACEILGNPQTRALFPVTCARFDAGRGARMLVTVAMRPHPVFRRDGRDILLTLPITLDAAVPRGGVTVPTIDGPVSLTFPPGASAGQALRLRGRGIARGHGTDTGRFSRSSHRHRPCRVRAAGRVLPRVFASRGLAGIGADDEG